MGVIYSIFAYSGGPSMDSAHCTISQLLNVVLFPLKFQEVLWCVSDSN